MYYITSLYKDGCGHPRCLLLRGEATAVEPNPTQLTPLNNEHYFCASIVKDQRNPFRVDIML